MPAGGMRMDPAGVRGGAAKIGNVGDDLKKVFDKLKAALDAEGDCWGRDEVGQKFADQYVPGQEGATEALPKVAKALAGIKTNLDNTVEDTEGRDRQASSDIGSIQP